jgi:chromosome segregation ATPase
LEESKALLEAAVRGQRQVEQELSDTREQMADMQAANAGLGNQKRKTEGDIHQMQADLDNMLGQSKGAEEKAKKAMVDAGRLADELRAEQDHTNAQEKGVKSTEKVLDDLGQRAEDASIHATLSAQQLPVKLEGRSREIEHELNRTVQMTAEFHKNIIKGERRTKELMFQSEENKNNQDRIADLVEKLQQKIKSYKKQIEEAEEIAAINLAKYRKAQQELEEAEERSRLAEMTVTKYRQSRGGSPI